ncbi:MFS transporter [Ferruginibacter sp. SUN002]|uniref:MFS transporter n=1 Tax=Ferruginibacter sp. SUN002 TaxID=2937789 RepID=UPI003D36AA3F
MQQTTTTTTFTGYQKMAIAILALIQFAVVLDFMVLSPLGDVLMKSLDISPKQFGFTVSAYAFSAGISGVLAAGFADKFDRKKMLLVFFVGFIGGTLFCALANNYHTLLFARIITGLFGGVIGAISMAIVADIFAMNQRGRVMGFIQMSFAASQVLGIPIGLYFSNIWGWHAPFLMIVILGLLVALMALFQLKPVTAHLALQSDKSAFLHLWHTVTNKKYRVGFLATAFLSTGGFMMMPFGSAFLVNNIGILNEQLPLIFMITGIGSLIIMPIIGKLSDKIDKFKIFAAGSLWATVMVIVYTHMSVMPMWLVILINVILFMGIMSRIVPATALVSAIPEMKDRGAFMSINASLQQMSGGIAAAFAGMVVVQKTKFSPLEHYDTLGFIVAGLMLLTIYLVYRVSKVVKNKYSAADNTIKMEKDLVIAE